MIVNASQERLRQIIAEKLEIISDALLEEKKLHAPIMVYIKRYQEIVDQMEAATINREDCYTALEDLHEDILDFLEDIDYY